MYEISLEGQTCIITGASQGIGKGIALVLAEAGLRGITIMDIKKDEQGEQTEKELQALGTEVLYIVGDASREETVIQAVEATVAQWGRIDMLVNNAGVAFMTDFETTTAEQWDLVLDVNLRTQFLTIKHCSEVMKKQGQGCIVNMSSISGITGGSTGPEYGASKAGVIGLTKYAAKLLGPHQIRVNAVAPGTIATDMIKRNYAKLTPEQRDAKLASIPMKRMGEPEEVGKAVLFLVSDLGSYISGEILGVMGARTH